MSFYVDSVGSTLGEERRRYSRVTFGTASIASQLGALISVARTGVGTYTVTMPRGYPRVAFFETVWVTRTGAQLFPRMTSEANLGSQGVFAFSLVDSTGAAVEPVAGDVLAICVATNETTAGAL